MWWWTSIYRKPKRLHNENVHGTKIFLKVKEMLLTSIAKTEHSPTTESYQSNVHTGAQSSATTTVDNEGSSWGYNMVSKWYNHSWLSNPDKNKSSHTTISQTNDFKNLSVKISKSIVLNENKSEGKVVMWATPCSVMMHSKTCQLESWGTLPSQLWKSSLLHDEDFQKWNQWTFQDLNRQWMTLHKFT